MTILKKYDYNDGTRISLLSKGMLQLWQNFSKFIKLFFDLKLKFPVTP